MGLFPKNMCVSRGVRKVSISEHFSYVLNEWSQCSTNKKKGKKIRPGFFPVEIVSDRLGTNVWHISVPSQQ